MPYSPITDAEIEPGKPGSSGLFTKIRDNPEAIASGDPAAPKIVNDAFNDNVISLSKILATNADLIIDLTPGIYTVPKGIYYASAISDLSSVSLFYFVNGSFKNNTSINPSGSTLIVTDGLNAQVDKGTSSTGTLYLKRIF